MLNEIQLTWWELFGVLGLSHSVFLLVYMAFRAGRIARASVAIGYFLILSSAFLADFGTRYVGEVSPYYKILQDMLWLAGPYLTYLLIVQAIEIDRLPQWRHYFVLLGVPIVLGVAQIINAYIADYEVALSLAGVGVGGLAMLSIWFKREELGALLKDQKSHGGERYWLVLAMIIINVAFLASVLVFASNHISREEFLTIRNILGLGLVYLASTSLFRIYPQAVRVTPKAADALTDDDRKLVPRLEDLLNNQKVYQEPSYGRADLARELNVPEATLSRLVNLHYGKSLPQILNERRVDDACRLLADTEAQIAVIAEQVGFNSLASFNRAFREKTGKTPSEYKKQLRENGPDSPMIGKRAG